MPDLEPINSFLDKMAEANGGADHCPYYHVDLLPTADSISEALDCYFSAMHTSLSPPQKPAMWNIRTAKLIDPVFTLRTAAQHWFFELQYSPQCDKASMEKTLNGYMELLDSLMKGSSVSEVFVETPMFYDCVWRDFVFDGGPDRWFLHYGISD